jgi:hypothetical protein
MDRALLNAGIVRAVEFGSHPGGWMTGASTPPSSISRIASAGVKCVTGQCDWLLGSPWPHVWICASTICVRRLLVIEAEQLLRVVVQDLVGDFLRQAEALDIGKGLPVDLPILQHRIVAAGHDVIGAERFEGA